METNKTVTSATPATTPANGTAPDATQAPKKERAERFVIAVAPTKAEHDELVAYTAKLVGATNVTNTLGVKLDLPIAKVVLALALKQIRAK